MRPLLSLSLVALASCFQIALAADEPPIVELQTNVGTITFELDYDKAPISSNNFITYVKSGFYKNTLMHRTTVTNSFAVLQGGGFNLANGTQKTNRPPIINESNNGLSNLKGTVGMARTSNPNSATSQFYINMADNLGFDYINEANPGYAVFAKVIDGMDVVTNIGKMARISDVTYNSLSEVIYVENVYASQNYDKNVSKTRITLSGSGKVTSTPAGIDCGSGGKKCSLTQAATGTLQLSVTPAAGSAFVRWQGDCSGVNRRITLDRTKGNHNCTALFARFSSARQ